MTTASNYSYSYCASWGSFLKEHSINFCTKIYSNKVREFSDALDEVNCSLEKIWKVVKAAFFGIASAYYVVYICPLVFVASKVLTAISSTKINFRNLHLKPESIDYSGVQVLGDLSYLHEEFVRRNLHNRQEFEYLRTNPDKTNIEVVMARVCGDVVDGRLASSRGELFASSMKLYLSAIIQKLQSDDISDCLKERVLVELAEAFNVCEPTWLTVAQKWSDRLHGNGTVRNKLLGYVQQFKEELIKEYVQIDMGQTQWHELSAFRNALGQELGLDDETSRQDFYAGTPLSGILKAIDKWRFLQKYGDVNKLIFSVKASIEAANESYAVCYRDFLIEVMRDLGKIPEEELSDYVTENFYDSNYCLKFEGVNLMLRSIGILC